MNVNLKKPNIIFIKIKAEKVHPKNCKERNRKSVWDKGLYPKNKNFCENAKSILEIEKKAELFFAKFTWNLEKRKLQEFLRNTYEWQTEVTHEYVMWCQMLKNAIMQLFWCFMDKEKTVGELKAEKLWFQYDCL